MCSSRAVEAVGLGRDLWLMQPDKDRTNQEHFPLFKAQALGEKESMGNCGFERQRGVGEAAGGML